MNVKDISNKELYAAVDSRSNVRDTWSQMVLAGYRGSLAHGTHGTEIDDIDVIGVFISPIKNYLGFVQKDGIESGPQANSPYDFVLYDLRKYVHLCLKGNPNVLNLLWLAENHYLFRSPVGEELIQMRYEFLSKQVYKSFSGYAHGQLKKMTHPAFEGYMGAKRRERYQQFGYDCKNASHLIRLLRMGVEVLTTEELIVLRPDASELLAIKNGEWTLEQVKSETHRLQNLLDEAYVRSSLPSHPDIDHIEKWLIRTIQNEIRFAEI